MTVWQWMAIAAKFFFLYFLWENENEWKKILVGNDEYFGDFCGNGGDIHWYCGHELLEK